MTKSLTIQMLKTAVKNHSSIEYEFPDVDYTGEEPIDKEGFEADMAKVIDVQTANVLLTVYNALNKKSRVKFRSMLPTFKTFEKLVNFAWSRVK